MLFQVLNNVQHFVSNENEVVIPKSVRPIIEYDETHLGERKGSNRQFRLGDLHIREYNEYYTAHVDKIDPRKNPLGHLLVDAPQYLVAILAAISVGRHVSSITYNDNINNYKKKGFASNKGLIAGSIAGSISYIACNIVKETIKSRLINE